jgi:hypothetical protein
MIAGLDPSNRENQARASDGSDGGVLRIAVYFLNRDRIRPFLEFECSRQSHYFIPYYFY